MNRSGSEKPTAIGAQLLDGNLAGGWSHWHQVGVAGKTSHGGVGGQALDHALAYQHDGYDQRQRQQYVQDGAGNVHPEIAQTLDWRIDGRFAVADAADQG